MKELIFDIVTNTLFQFVVRRCNAVQICLMAVYMKLASIRPSGTGITLHSFSQIIHDLLRGKWQFLSRPVTHCHLIRSGQYLFPAAFSVEFHALSKSLILCPKDMAVYKKELTSDKVTNTLSMFVERHCNAVQIRLMAVYKKELYFDRVTNALFIFVVRRWNVVQICLMAVI